MLFQEPIDLKTRFALRLATLWLKLCLRLTKYADDRNFKPQFHHLISYL